MKTTVYFEYILVIRNDRFKYRTNLNYYSTGRARY